MSIGKNVKVVDSRKQPNYTRRKCVDKETGRRFNTIEVMISEGYEHKTRTEEAYKLIEFVLKNRKASIKMIEAIKAISIECENNN